MSSFVRASKFRHIYCDPPKSDATYTNFRISTVTGEQSYIKANSLFFAVGLQGGGGPFTVIPLSKPGRKDNDIPMFTGHSAAVLDFDFNPFHEQIIASASEDATVKVWGIPDGGLIDNISEPLVDLHGHGRKVTLLRFHPTANNVLASAAGDCTVKLWDIEKGSAINTWVVPGDNTPLIQDIVWDYTGTSMACSSKDKNIRIIDARSATELANITMAHEGAKSVKLAYLGNLGNFVSVGFTRQSQRQLKIWDPRKLSVEIKKVDIDQGAGVVMPFYDPDTNLLYLAGKGEGVIRFYEFIGESPYCFPIADSRSATTAKGMCMVPKRGLNIMANETARLMKLTQSNSVEALSFMVPRRSEMFQDDLYPPTAAPEPAHSADQWLSGSNKAPRLMSLNPAAAGKVGGALVPPTTVNVSVSATAPAKAPARTAAQLQADLDAANTRIAMLEARLASAGLSSK